MCILLARPSLSGTASYKTAAIRHWCQCTHSYKGAIGLLVIQRRLVQDGATERLSSCRMAGPRAVCRTSIGCHRHHALQHRQHLRISRYPFASRSWCMCVHARAQVSIYRVVLLSVVRAVSPRSGYDTSPPMGLSDQTVAFAMSKRSKPDMSTGVAGSASKPADGRTPDGLLVQTFFPMSGTASDGEIWGEQGPGPCRLFHGPARGYITTRGQ